MEESIAILTFIVIVILMLVLFLQVGADVGRLQLQLVKQTREESERLKDRLEMVWLGRYHVVLTNEGDRHSNLTAMYVYTSDPEVPSQIINLGNMVLPSDYSKVFNILPIVTEQPVKIKSDNIQSIEFQDSDFLSKDFLVYGPINYALFRNISCSTMSVNSVPFSSPKKKWTICTWLRVGNRQYEILNNDDDGDHEYCKDAGEGDCAQIVNLGQVKISVVKRDGGLWPVIRVRGKELRGWWDAREWVHICAYIDGSGEEVVRLYIQGVPADEKSFSKSVKVDQLKLLGSDAGYSIDELTVISDLLSDEEIRTLASTGKLPSSLSSEYLKFSFDKVGDEVLRLDIVTDLGVRYNFTRPTPKDGPYIVSTPEMQPEEVNEPWGTVYRAYMGPVPLTALYPVWTSDSNWQGSYLVLYNEDFAVWNVTGYNLFLEVTKGYDGTAGGMLQMILSADLIMRPARAWYYLGHNITVPLVRISDGEYLELVFTMDTLSLTDLSKNDDVITGRVVWSSKGTDFTKDNGWWTSLLVVCLETGDQAAVRGDGTFELHLSKPLTSATLGIFLPEEFYNPGFRGYMIPYSGTYVVGGD